MSTSRLRIDWPIYFERLADYLASRKSSRNIQEIAAKVFLISCGGMEDAESAVAKIERECRVSLIYEDYRETLYDLFKHAARRYTGPSDGLALEIILLASGQFAFEEVISPGFVSRLRREAYEARENAMREMNGEE